MKRYPATSIPRAQFHGRWFPSDVHESMLATWSSASLPFLFSGTRLSFHCGTHTERKDKDNGGTPMLAIISGSSKENARLDVTKRWRTVDPRPDDEIVLFGSDLETLDESPNLQNGVQRVHDRTYVEIVLIDWASTFELKALTTDDNGQIDFEGHTNSRKKIVVVGDSITSVMTTSPKHPVPHGILDGFIFVAQRNLAERKRECTPSGPNLRLNVEFEVISYPGVTLVIPTEEEKEAGKPVGMKEVFFWKSFWSKESFTPNICADAVLIALGTNDQFHEISKERFAQSLADFINQLRTTPNSSRIRHVWIVPPFPDSDADNRELNDAMANFIIPYLQESVRHCMNAGESEDISVGICDLVEGLTDEDTIDGVHPSLGVHERLGKKLCEFIGGEMFGK